MFWRLFVAGFVLNKNNIRYYPTIKMSEMSIDEPVEPFDDGNDFLKKIIENDNFYSLEEIL